MPIGYSNSAPPGASNVRRLRSAPAPVASRTASLRALQVGRCRVIPTGTVYSVGRKRYWPTTPVLAVFCAAEDEISGALCARIGCDGLHSSDGLDAWTEPNDDENGSR